MLQRSLSLVDARWQAAVNDENQQSYASAIFVHARLDNLERLSEMFIIFLLARVRFCWVRQPSTPAPVLSPEQLQDGCNLQALIFVAMHNVFEAI